MHDSSSVEKVNTRAAPDRSAMNSNTLDGIAMLPDQKTKIEQYKTALQIVINAASIADANNFVDHSKPLSV